MTNTHFTMPKVRVLVANASKARFFRVETPAGELIEMNAAANPQARLHERDLITDRRGRQRGPNGQGSGAVEESTDPKNVEISRFAVELSRQLDKERTSGNLERLYLVASPPFLGELRKHLSNEVKPLVAEEINKDLSPMPAKELRKHLPQYLK